MIEQLTAALDETGADYRADGPRSVVVTLPGSRKLAIACGLVVEDHALRVECFVARRPEERHEAVWAELLRRNGKLYAVAFAVDEAEDIHLVGRLPHTAICADELDRVLGQVLEAADDAFNAILELGFRTSIEDEWRWRLARGESTRNLDAFEHLRPTDLEMAVGEDALGSGRHLLGALVEVVEGRLVARDVGDEVLPVHLVLHRFEPGLGVTGGVVLGGGEHLGGQFGLGVLQSGGLLDLPRGLEVTGETRERTAQVDRRLEVVAASVHACGPVEQGLLDAPVARPVGAAAGPREPGVVEVVGVRAAGDRVLGLAHAAAPGALGRAEVRQLHRLGLHVGRTVEGGEVGVPVLLRLRVERVRLGVGALVVLVDDHEGDRGVVDADAVDLRRRQRQVRGGVHLLAEHVLQCGRLGELESSGVHREAQVLQAQSRDAFQRELDLVGRGHVRQQHRLGGGPVDRVGRLGAAGQRGRGEDRGQGDPARAAAGRARGLRHRSTRRGSSNRSPNAMTCRCRRGRGAAVRGPRTSPGRPTATSRSIRRRRSRSSRR
ncbi:YbjN domain-containing protein [Glycomyces paridis]|uniref:YbjN domain-containing protein n=1 Tax=Glycomyces paridis TaxID=2126555 RepID=A0A4S8PCR1_9ACTN|nr:YbjN domain-containing protein [Glycomyces paridis]